MIRCVFRSPAFPIIIDIDGHIVAARSVRGLEKKLSVLELLPGRSYDAVDSTGETWFLHRDAMLLSPLTLKKRAAKIQLIKMVNGRKNKTQDEKPYYEKSISSKTYDAVFDDLVEILS